MAWIWPDPVACALEPNLELVLLKGTRQALFKQPPNARPEQVFAGRPAVCWACLEALLIGADLFQDLPVLVQDYLEKLAQYAAFEHCRKPAVRRGDPRKQA